MTYKRDINESYGKINTGIVLGTIYVTVILRNRSICKVPGQGRIYEWVEVLTIDTS